MSFDKKQIVLDKLNTLTELLQDVHQGDTDNLFHEDWIEVTDTIAKIERSGEAKKETLDRMNIIWRKNQMIKKYGENHNGKKAPYKDVIEWQVIAIVKNSGKITAIKFVRENLLGPNGEVMSLAEAKQFTDEVMIKNHIS
jgi:ribosomal protein L7/L12